MVVENRLFSASDTTENVTCLGSSCMLSAGLLAYGWLARKEVRCVTCRISSIGHSTNCRVRLVPGMSVYDRIYDGGVPRFWASGALYPLGTSVDHPSMNHNPEVSK